MSDASPLYWFPVYRADWLNSASISAMLPEQEGAYWRLLVTAWGEGTAEPSLPTDDAQLAMLSRLGSRWKKLGPAVRAMFVERDGRLYNAKLSEVWAEQSTKHAKASEKARTAALARAEKRRLEAASSTASSTHGEGLLSRKNLDGSASPPTPNGVEGEKHEPAADASLARADAAPADVAADSGPPPTPLAADAEVRQERADAYRSALETAANAWMARFPEATRAIGAEQRTITGAPRGTLTPWQTQTLRQAVVEAIRQRAGWPTLDEWDGEPFGEEKAA